MPAVGRSASRPSSVSASRATEAISSAIAAARSGSRSAMPTEPPAWIAITLMLCATASCSSRATRIRSLVTAAAASRMRRRSTSTPFSRSSSVSRRLPLTRRPTVHGSATPPSSAATTPSG